MLINNLVLFFTCSANLNILGLMLSNIFCRHAILSLSTMIECFSVEPIFNFNQSMCGVDKDRVGNFSQISSFRPQSQTAFTVRRSQVLYLHIYIYLDIWRQPLTATSVISPINLFFSAVFCSIYLYAVVYNLFCSRIRFHTSVQSGLLLLTGASQTSLTS